MILAQIKEKRHLVSSVEAISSDNITKDLEMRKRQSTHAHVSAVQITLKTVPVRAFRTWVKNKTSLSHTCIKRKPQSLSKHGKCKMNFS